MTSPLQSLRARYRTSRLFRWTADLLMLALLVWVVGLFQTRNHARGVAPAYAFSTLEGGSSSFGDLAGKPTIVAVWAPWCSVCKAESDNVSRVRRWLGDRAHVVSVATAFEDVSQVRAYMAAQQVDYPVLLARDDFSQVMGIGAFPTVFVLDAKGNVVSSMQGYTTTLGLYLRALLLT
ncbi:MAG: TlpA family protein disulfide reductase [Myxococcota bacterium]